MNILAEPPIHVDAIAIVMIDFVKHQFIDELPVSAQTKVCVLAEQPGLLVGEM